MPRYDQHCLECSWIDEIRCAPGEHPPCPVCGGKTERIFLGGYMFERDEIPGGTWVENLGHEPVKVYSKSELRMEAEKRGLVQRVVHKPLPGSDKGPNTQRFV